MENKVYDKDGVEILPSELATLRANAKKFNEENEEKRRKTKTRHIKVENRRLHEVLASLDKKEVSHGDIVETLKRLGVSVADIERNLGSGNEFSTRVKNIVKHMFVAESDCDKYLGDRIFCSSKMLDALKIVLSKGLAGGLGMSTEYKGAQADYIADLPHNVMSSPVKMTKTFLGVDIPICLVKLPQVQNIEVELSHGSFSVGGTVSNDVKGLFPAKVSGDPITVGASIACYEVEDPEFRPIPEKPEVKAKRSKFFILVDNAGVPFANTSTSTFVQEVLDNGDHLWSHGLTSGGTFQARPEISYEIALLALVEVFSHAYINANGANVAGKISYIINNNELLTSSAHHAHSVILNCSLFLAGK